MTIITVEPPSARNISRYQRFYCCIDLYPIFDINSMKFRCPLFRSETRIEQIAGDWVARRIRDEFRCEFHGKQHDWRRYWQCRWNRCYRKHWRDNYWPFDRDLRRWMPQCSRHRRARSELRFQDAGHAICEIAQGVEITRKHSTVLRSSTIHVVHQGSARWCFSSCRSEWNLGFRRPTEQTVQQQHSNDTCY